MLSQRPKTTSQKAALASKPVVDGPLDDLVVDVEPAVREPRVPALRELLVRSQAVDAGGRDRVVEDDIRGHQLVRHVQSAPGGQEVLVVAAGDRTPAHASLAATVRL